MLKIVGADYRCTAIFSSFSDPAEAFEVCLIMLESAVSSLIFREISPKLAEAEALLKDMQSWMPKSHRLYSGTWGYLGDIYEMQSRNQEACAAFTKSLNLLLSLGLSKEGISVEEAQYLKESFESKLAQMEEAKERVCN